MWLDVVLSLRYGSDCVLATDRSLFNPFMIQIDQTLATLKPRSTSGHCRRPVEQNTLLLWEQTNFDFTVGQSLVSEENSACYISIGRNTIRWWRQSLSVVRRCLIVDRGLYSKVTWSRQFEPIHTDLALRPWSMEPIVGEERIIIIIIITIIS